MSTQAVAEQDDGLTILLVEDDHGDAVLVQAFLVEAGIGEDAVTWTRSSAEAVVALKGNPDCVLLDLGLPDAVGVQAVQGIVGAAPDVAVIVLTGRQERDGIDALAAGAQDYLVKDDLSGALLERSVRYAVERKRADRAQQRLRLSAAEQVRLERGLLPTPLLRSGVLDCATYYRPGSDGAVLGGDFFDVVELEDGTVRAVIGDVMGHGPDEAALGVHLRVGWRTLLLSGTPSEQVLPTLARLLLAEQTGSPRFATVCDLTITAHTLTVRLAGHPAPIVCTSGAARYPTLTVGPPLGIERSASAARWPANDVPLDPRSAIVLYTDGLLDAYAMHNREGTLGIDELVAAVAGCARDGGPVDTWIPRLVGGAPQESLDDTAAVVLATRDAGR